MDTSDEIPVEEHRYFQARLDHLESRHPALLLNHLAEGTLTNHLRQVTMRAMQAKGSLVVYQNLPENQAEELVMEAIVTDPAEPFTPLRNGTERMEFWRLLADYKEQMPNLPRTYLSQSETME